MIAPFNVKKLLLVCTSSLGLAVAATGSAQALSLSQTSPLGGGSSIPTGVSSVGGIVLDLRGLNGNRVTSQLAASRLFQGFYPSTNNVGTIGTQTGFTASVLNALGGGISEAAVRFTLFDGDTADGNFDEDENTLLLNGLNFGNWSDVRTEETSGTGAPTGNFSDGFRNDILDTGWFYSNNATLLGSLFGTLTSTEQIIYQVSDVDPGDNFYDFKRGIEAELIDVGTGPVVSPPGTPIPTPALLPGLIGMGMAVLRKRKAEAANQTSEA